jgi:hypothetical protein
LPRSRPAAPARRTSPRRPFYVAGSSYEAQSAVWQVVRGSEIGRAPSTLVGVPILGYRGQLVEVEAIALID